MSVIREQNPKNLYRYHVRDKRTESKKSIGHHIRDKRTKFRNLYRHHVRDKGTLCSAIYSYKIKEFMIVKNCNKDNIECYWNTILMNAYPLFHGTM